MATQATCGWPSSSDIRVQSGPSYIDARGANFYDISGDQYNITPRGQDLVLNLGPMKFDPSKRTGCLPNTRADVQKIIVDWVNDSSSQQNLFWLRGLAGSGKSTLSTTIASIFRELQRLGAFLFFDRFRTETSDPSIVIRTLAFQLCTNRPQVQKLVSAAIDKDPHISQSPLAEQFQKLLLSPLSALEWEGEPLVLIVDALDECGTADERKALLEVLANNSRYFPAAIRTIITSRPDSDIRDAFESHEHILVHELDIASQANSDDILTYFRHCMSHIREKNKRLRLDADWPGEEILGQLVKRAWGLFAWASTASKFIDGHDPRNRLHIILKGEPTSGAEAALDTLYKTALEVVGSWKDEDFIADFREILGTILIAGAPLSIIAIDQLLQLPRPSIHTIFMLGCVLQQSSTIHVLHPSFADFLMTKERCGRDTWFFDRSVCHERLALRCLERMDPVLKRNMCRMTLSRSLVNECLAEAVSYACIYWVDHFCLIKEKGAIIMEPLRIFLDQHLLHWFEAMSILRETKSTVLLLDRLLHRGLTHLPKDSGIVKLVNDAWQFARTFARFMEEHPLLVYAMALPFAPTHSLLYQNFHDSRVYPSVAGGFRESWSPLLLVLGGHQKEILSVSLSDDGLFIVSGSSDHTVRMWDSTSGCEVIPTLTMRRHCDKVSSVLFSSDGSCIISGSHDTTVRIWDSVTGTIILPVLRGHKRSVLAIACSPDGARVVSGSDDRTVRVWNTVSGAQTNVFQHKHTVTSVAVTPDGTRIISGSYDNSIRIWDVNSDVPFPPLMTIPQDDWVLSLSLSPDGTSIASGSEDGMVRVWDAATGVRLLALQGHNTRVQAVSFSSDGTRIASCSDDRTIRIWNAASQTQSSWALQGHHSYVQCIAFFPDGKRLVSGSGDTTIRIWDATRNAEAPVQHDRHSCSVTSVAFSFDGKRVASGSFDNTIRIWDTTSGTQILLLRGHGGAIFSVAFSPDGTRIVSSSQDTYIRVWSVVTGKQVMTELRRRDRWVSCVRFSADGSRIVSGSKEDSIQMWDATSGARIRFPGQQQQGRSTFLDESQAVVSKLTGKLINALDAALSLPVTWADHYNINHPNHVPPSTISVLNDGWIIDLTTGEKIGKLPLERLYFEKDSKNLKHETYASAFAAPNEGQTSTPVRHFSNHLMSNHQESAFDSKYASTYGSALFSVRCAATYSRSLVIGTSNGQVLVMHFPDGSIELHNLELEERRERNEYK